MIRTGILTGMLAVLAVGLITMMSSPIAAQDEQQREQDRGTPRSAEEIKEYTGLVVDLYHYLTNEDYRFDDNDDADVAGQHNGGPVGLLTTKEGMIRTTTELRVIAFASREDARQLQRRTNDMIGQRVRIVGYECKRDGVAAIAVKNLTEYQGERTP